MQVLFYPSSQSVLLTVIDIVPVSLTALFWGMVPGLVAGLVSTASLVVLEAIVSPSILLDVAALGALFFAGVGTLLGRVSDLSHANKRRAASLDAARARLASILSAAKDAVITIDPEGRVTSWNAAAERMFGWSASEALGRELHGLVASPRHRGGAGTPVPSFPRPDEDRAIHTTLEMEAQRRDGSIFPVELSLASFVQDGRRHAVGIVRDILERRQSEARFRRLFETVPVGLYRTSRNGTVLDANPACVELLGYPDRDALLARNAESLFADADVRERLLQRVEREPAVHREVRLLRYDGSIRECLISLRAERGPDGGITGYEGSLRDVSDVKRLEALRRQAGRLETVDALAAGVAHDFSNILTGIRGYAEHLAGAADTSVGGIGRRIIEAVDRADRITADLLSVLGGFRFQAQPATLDEICRIALADRGPEAGGSVKLVAAPETVTVMVDRAAIASVIRELAENAVHASPDGAPVVLRTGSAPDTDGSVLGPASTGEGPWAWISVTDRGTGMAESVRERIFEPYFTTRPFGSGAGLGLVRVLGILRQHGGGISVDTAPGRGTTMTIYLPMAPARA